MYRITTVAGTALTFLVVAAGCGRLSSHPVVVMARDEVTKNPRVIDFLADASEFFRANVRRLDIVARYGETGFAIILPSTGTSTDLVRQRLIKKTSKWTTGRFGPTGSVTVEVGYASAPDTARSGAQLIARIELAPLSASAVIAA